MGWGQKKLLGNVASYHLPMKGTTDPLKTLLYSLYCIFIVQRILKLLFCIYVHSHYVAIYTHYACMYVAILYFSPILYYVYCKRKNICCEKISLYSRVLLHHENIVREMQHMILVHV